MNHIAACADSICLKNNFDDGFTTEEYSEEESSVLLDTWLKAATTLADQAFPAASVV